MTPMGDDSGSTPERSFCADRRRNPTMTHSQASFDRFEESSDDYPDFDKFGPTMTRPVADVGDCLTPPREVALLDEQDWIITPGGRYRVDAEDDTDDLETLAEDNAGLREALENQGDSQESDGAHGTTRAVADGGEIDEKPDTTTVHGVGGEADAVAVEVPEDVNGWILTADYPHRGFIVWANNGAVQDGRHTVSITKNTSRSFYVAWDDPEQDGSQEIATTRAADAAVDAAVGFMEGMEGPDHHRDDDSRICEVCDDEHEANRTLEDGETWVCDDAFEDLEPAEPATDGGVAKADFQSLDEIGRGSVLSLDTQKGEFLVIDRKEVPHGTVQSLDVVDKQGNEFRLQVVALGGERYFDVTQGHETAVVKNTANIDDARDFDVIRHDQEWFEEYLAENIPHFEQ